jgi:hypothetical protein
MVTDLMADETALTLASVLGERNEGFILMTYVPDSTDDYVAAMRSLRSCGLI